MVIVYHKHLAVEVVAVVAAERIPYITCVELCQTWPDHSHQ